MNKINGIDVSEEIRYCNNCSNLGLDFKTGKFYCSLSHRPDELPEVLSCDEFSTNCYIKRLQEENKELKKRQITKNGFICDCEQNAKYRQALEKIRSNCNNYAKTESYVIDDTFNEFLEIIFDKSNEVLNDRD